MRPNLLSLTDPRDLAPLLIATVRRTYGPGCSFTGAAVTVVRDQFGEHRNLALRYDIGVKQGGRQRTYRWRGNANADLATVRRRHRTLTYLYRHLPRGTVPRPLAYSARRHLSLYEEVVGATPQQLFDSGRRAVGLSAARAAARPLGLWLRRLHRLTPPPGLASSWADPQPLSSAIGRAALPAAKLSSRAAAELRRLGQRLEQLRPRPRRTALLHGDLQLGNVVVHGSQVTAIDFSDACRGDRWLDVATFLLHTEELLRYPLPKSYSRLTAELTARFLSAYGTPRTADDRHRLAWATAAVATRSATYVTTATGRRADNLRGLRRLTERATVALDELSR